MNPFGGGGGRVSPDNSSLGGNDSMDGDGATSEDDSFSDDDETTQQNLDNEEFDSDLDSKSCMWLGTEDRQ